MRLQVIIIFLFLFGYSFGQDTINKIKLKPVNDLHILSPIVTNTSLEKEKNNDSIYNSDTCQMIRKKVEEIYNKNEENFLKEKNKVIDLNNKNWQYYYYLIISYKPFPFDTIGRYKDCYYWHTLMYDKMDVENQIPMEVCKQVMEFKIDKKEKSRIILDGPSGEVFYYDDIKRMPIK